jgi:hypothetical protein
MLATGTSLGCGMTIAVALWTSKPTVAEPPPVPAAPASQVYHFPQGTMVITPGPVAANALRPLPPRPLTPDHATAIRRPTPTIRQATYSTAQDSTAQPPFPPLTDTGDEPAADAVPPTPVVTADRAQAYRRVYDSIPFSRAEYDANPSYRHDATMEFLFGQLRPTVIHRGQTTVTVRSQDDAGDIWSPWVYYGRSGWYAPFPAPGYRVYRGW